MTQAALRIRIQRSGSVEVPIPAYQTRGSAGLDLCAAIREPVLIKPGERRMISTGLVFEIPEGYEGQVRPRSGLAYKNGISVINTPGTIDADYRGVVGVVLINLGQEPFVVEPLSRIAQLVIAPVIRVELELAEQLGETERGGGGYGSTGH
jgi:dUTP pyrophosphatase